MMAQKVNALSLRQNRRLNWNVVICSHNFMDYVNQITNAETIMTIFDTALSRLKLLTNVLIFKKLPKYYTINCNVLDQNSYFLFFNTVNSIQKLNSNNLQHRYVYIRLFQSIFRKFSIAHGQLFVQTQKLIKKQFKPTNWLLSPKIFTAFVQNQIVAIDRLSLNQNAFIHNLQKKLLLLITTILNTVKYNIRGLKIICSGKWRKTSSGRKQKIYLKFGQIQSSNLANKILFNKLSQKNKYGVYSIKIWISYNSN